VSRTSAIQARHLRTPMNASHNRYLFSQIFFGLLLGAVACIAAVVMSGLEMKYTLSLAVGLVFVVVVLQLATFQKLIVIALILMAMGIPFNLDINLFYRDYIGVTSVDIGVTLLAALALYILFIYARLTSRQATPFAYNRTLLWAPLFYIAAGVLSFYHAVSNELVLLELVRLVTLFIIFFIVMNLKDRRQMSIFILTLSVGVVLEALIAFYQYKTGRSLGLGVFGEGGTVEQFIGTTFARTSGTIGHPNILAYYFEMLIPLMFGMSMGEEKGGHKLWYFLATMAGLGGLLLTLSRGGWLTVPVSISTVFFCMVRGRIMQSKTLVTIFFAAFAMLIALYLMAPTIERRILYEDYGSFKSRGPLNAATFSIVKQFPVTGVGLNNLPGVYQTLDTTGGSGLSRGAKIIGHNMLLAVWAEVGTIGIAAFLWIFAATLLVALRLFSKVSHWDQGVLIGASTGLTAHLIHSLVDPGFRIKMSTSMLVYCLIGLVGAVSVRYNRMSRAAKKEASPANRR
jgi:O-antigen ligase